LKLNKMYKFILHSTADKREIKDSPKLPLALLLIAERFKKMFDISNNYDYNP